uniref:Uncharacterized protein n=1 Tax=Oryza sativa subsp. japonica TaxID=39947 RepID=Q69SS4_ORYSJ|nr:hypothetical protein [Oryza sativa Japonica Group]BAD35961.1 hypothetical protein [Oryza sativa Japonica Group]
MRLTPVARPRPAPTTSGVEDAAAGDELRHGGRGRRRAPAWGMVAWTAEDLRAWRTQLPAEAWTTDVTAGDELPTEDAVVGDEFRCGPWTGEDAAAGDEVRVQCGAWTGEDAAAGDDASTPRRLAPGI